MTTIAEWNKIDRPLEVRGVHETIMKTSELGPFLQFMDAGGSSVDYERELTLPVASVVSDEGTFAESSQTFTEKTETLKTVYIQEALNNKKKQMALKQDPLAIMKFQMAKSFRRKLEDLAINGQVSGNTLEFKGLLKWCIDDTRMMAMDDGEIDGPGSAETELTQDRLDEMLDMEEGDPWDAIVMNKTMRRKLTQLARAAGSGVNFGSIEMFGRRVMTYRDYPIIIDDWISNSEQYGDSGTWPSSTATTIFAVKFGVEKDGFTIFHNGPYLNTEFIELPQPRYTNETPYRLISYPGSVVWSPLGVAALGGIDSNA